MKWLRKADSASGSFITPITLIRLSFCIKNLEKPILDLFVCLIVRLVKKFARNTPCATRCPSTATRHPLTATRGKVLPIFHLCIFLVV